MQVGPLAFQFAWSPRISLTEIVRQRRRIWCHWPKDLQLEREDAGQRFHIERDRTTPKLKIPLPEGEGRGEGKKL